MPSMASLIPFYDSFTSSSSSTTTSTTPKSSLKSSPLLLPLISTFLCFLYFTSSPMSSNRELTKFSLYKSINLYLHTWCLSTILLYVVGLDFSSSQPLSPSVQHNVVVSASIFIPSFLSTLASILLFKLLLRFVTLLRTSSSPPPVKSSASSLKWFRPLRQVFNIAVFVSILTSAVQGHCWNSSSATFSGENGLYCGWIFSDLEEEEEKGGGEIWKVWGKFVVVAGLNIVMEEEKRLREIFKTSPPISPPPSSSKSKSPGPKVSTSFDDYVSSDDEDLLSYDRPTFPSTSVLEKPKNTLMMVPWYSLLLVYTAFDIIIQLKVMLGRYDARSMQASVHGTWGGSRSVKHSPSSPSKTDEDEEGNEEECTLPAGCVFDVKARNEKDDFWFDFMADCGDGFNSSYQVAKVLAQPELTVMTGNRKEEVKLPRGDILVIGGDLAYPDPSIETFEKRFFRTFEDAMPPPSSYRKSAIATTKPNLPVKGWRDIYNPKRGKTPLEQYEGPQAFVFPGNHDWFDGLATYARLVLSRDWLGGWLMPQERSYFAICLPKGWWLLGVDLALAEDIDLEQFRFFADVASKRIGKDDAVVIMTHEPYWVLDAAEDRTDDECAETNLRELMETHLQGKVRLRLAGDLHHYTRHVPVKKAKKNSKNPPATTTNATTTSSQTYTAGLDGGNLAAAAKKMALSKGRESRSATVESNHASASDDVDKSNIPQLIVSGGGGAFLHPTHTFANSIKVNFGGSLWKNYQRKVAYPSESACYRLSWLNIWQFRWRNWRMDVLWGVLYLGIVSSLLPLCGIYASYVQDAEGKGLLPHVLWYVQTLVQLLSSIFSSGRLSALLVPATLFGLFQLCDETISPKLRIFWGAGHGFAHVVAALSCLMFVEFVTEWSIDVSLVSIDPVKNETLASSMYGEYEANFAKVFDTLPDVPQIFGDSPNITTVAFVDISSGSDAVTFVASNVFSLAVSCLSSLWSFPLVKFLFTLFDVPSLIAHKHSTMCSALCASSPCFASKDPLLFSSIPRYTILTYFLSISMYFAAIAIPCAGAIFGSWLALTLNVFNAQYNEGFSSLRIQHWKNVLRCRVMKNGDLEVYGLGIDRVPKSWVKDSEWGGSPEAVRKRERSKLKEILRTGKKGEEGDIPSWRWKQPSMWKAEKESVKHVPRIIDHVIISKRESRAGGSEELERPDRASRQGSV
ncbi:hypothetical protein TrVE_jg6357 [Triparma verrucosa]|uniref:Calcineurin-like phosphoesterase domain-containing protein n=1 Tax=Triparma verrucosa TaxID=1606542 RepID=A0A9W7EQ76_9STRA|nr:hypothetical protein TrVE_jg6357 [Triparma verrucosa]